MREKTNCSQNDVVGCIDKTVQAVQTSDSTNKKALAPYEGNQCANETNKLIIQMVEEECFLLCWDKRIILFFFVEKKSKERKKSKRWTWSTHRCTQWRLHRWPTRPMARCPEGGWRTSRACPARPVASPSASLSSLSQSSRSASWPPPVTSLPSPPSGTYYHSRSFLSLFVDSFDWVLLMRELVIRIYGIVCWELGTGSPLELGLNTLTHFITNYSLTVAFGCWVWLFQRLITSEHAIGSP